RRGSMPIARSGGIEINYRVEGSGPETILLVNGIGDDLEAWLMQTPEFVGAGLRVVSFDNRGIGRSSRPPGPYSSRQGAEDAFAVVSELGLTAFHLVGCSMGGLIALEYALAHPLGIRSLVLANTYAAPDAYTLAVLDAWSAILAAGGIATVMSQMAPWIFSPEFHEREAAILAGYVADMVRTPQTAESFAAQLAVLHDHDCRDRLGSITMPALVLVAEADILVRPALSARLLAGLPNAEWAVVPGGHAVMWENPDAWNRAIIDFVQRNTRGAG
ncbi:MAG: alpha/beta fold hydrolase, partial [Candidatus Limnocylindrales bacterium]